ncbi:MAG: hypothetical protein ACMXYG_07430 [Candidatus Woesearchaeota archaeon]
MKKQIKVKSIKKKEDDCCKLGKDCDCKDMNCGGAFYGLGALGAAIYFISTATGFWIGVLGVLKALIWPLFLVYELFKFLGM